jgi:hypothetical protein
MLTLDLIYDNERTLLYGAGTLADDTRFAWLTYLGVGLVATNADTVPREDMLSLVQTHQRKVAADPLLFMIFAEKWFLQRGYAVAYGQRPYDKGNLGQTAFIVTMRLCWPLVRWVGGIVLKTQSADKAFHLDN